MDRDTTRYNHPSYGQLSFSRTTGSERRFYGSELKPGHFITMELVSSEMERSLSSTWYFGKRQLLQIRMTPNQFAELMTGMNQGSGIPVTIEYIKGEKIEDVPDLESGRTYTQVQFDQRMKDFAIDLKSKQIEANTIIDKKTLSKDDQSKLKGILGSAVQELTSNIPFFAKCFKEVMEKVVLDAKSEIDASLMHKIMTLGIEAMQDQINNNLLDSDNS